MTISPPSTFSFAGAFVAAADAAGLAAGDELGSLFSLLSEEQAVNTTAPASRTDKAALDILLVDNGNMVLPLSIG
ncbi:hypothetical protein D3C76_1696670 [compost metagenome]